MSDLAFTFPDNVIPPDVTRGHRSWGIDELFPGIGETLDPDVTYVVPNVHDFVNDVKNMKQYYVHSLDGNYKPELKPWIPNNVPDSQKNTLVGYGVGAVNEAYRVYYNKNTVPNTLVMSPYLHFKGKEVIGYRIFRGYDATDRGEVISRHYDQDGKFVSDMIPVTPHFSNGEWVSVPGVANVQDPSLKKNDPVTAVAFRADGGECSSALLTVVETNFTASLNRQFREVSGISVTSPMLDPNDSTRFLIPANTPIWNIIAKGVVHYTDGDSRQFNFDQSEGRLHGLESKVLTTPDVTYPLAASYYLSDGEVSVMEKGGAQRHITIPLSVHVYQPDGANVVKIFVVPEYISDTQGYKLNWWLHDLERNEPINVTGFVRYHDNYSFDPLSWNKTQDLIVSIDLELVHPRYTHYVHAQNLSIILVGEPSNNTDSWRIRYTEGAGWFGEDVACLTRTENEVSILNIANGHTRDVEFVIDFYQKMVPISDATAGEYAPNPTHFDLRYDGVTKRVAIADFAKDIIWSSVIPEGKTVEIVWLFEKGGQFGYLGITPLTVKGL